MYFYLLMNKDFIIIIIIIKKLFGLVKKTVGLVLY